MTTGRGVLLLALLSGGMAVVAPARGPTTTPGPPGGRAT